MKREAVVNLEESMEECMGGFGGKKGEVTDIVILLKYQEIYF